MLVYFGATLRVPLIEVEGSHQADLASTITMAWITAGIQRKKQSTKLIQNCNLSPSFRNTATVFVTEEMSTNTCCALLTGWDEDC